MGGPMVLAVEKLVTGLKGMRSRLGSWSNKEFLGRTKPKLDPPKDITSTSLYGNDDWKSKVVSSLKTQFPENGDIRTPDFFAAVIIAGNTLLKDTELAMQWRQAARHASGVEMELGGVCRAARYGADGKKTGDNREGCNPLISRAGNHLSFNPIHSQSRNHLRNPEEYDFEFFFTTFGPYVSPSVSRKGIDLVNEI